MLVSSCPRVQWVTSECEYNLFVCLVPVDAINKHNKYISMNQSSWFMGLASSVWLQFLSTSRIRTCAIETILSFIENYWRANVHWPIGASMSMSMSNHGVPWNTHHPFGRLSVQFRAWYMQSIEWTRGRPIRTLIESRTILAEKISGSFGRVRTQARPLIHSIV